MAKQWASEEEGRDAKDYQPEMPPVSGFVNLLDYLFQVGPVLQGGMGPARLTNEELLAWQTNNRRRLAPWECRFLIGLSGEYMREADKARRRDATPPWTPPDARPAPTAAQLALRALANL